MESNISDEELDDQVGKILFEEFDEIIERPVKPYGAGSAHALIPKKHIGKVARIMIKKQVN